MTTGLNRASFLRASTAGGAALVLAFRMPFKGEAAGAAFAPNAWISIEPDDRVVFTITKAEMVRVSRWGFRRCSPTNSTPTYRRCTSSSRRPRRNFATTGSGSVP